ncbi:MAG: CoA-binding protein, partial [Pseudomonadota bacterium]
MSSDPLRDLLYPSSIAIVGASDDPLRIGGRPLNYLRTMGFEGVIYPVNPKRDRVQDLTAYPSVADIPGQVDFVLIAVPAKLVVEAARQSAAKGAKTCLIFSSGFAEEGEEGAARQAELARIAADTGMRVLGPNCLGMFNSAHGFYPTFTGTVKMKRPTPGGISIASQSGAYGSHIAHVSNLRGLGVRYWITSGNECDLNTAEAIGLLARSPEVHTIMAYAESIKDGPALMRSLDDARAERKPVIMMKVGRSEIGAQAASSHTASLAGEDAVYDAILRQYGCIRAETTEQMLDIAYAARPRVYPAGRKLGVVTISGGAGVLIADAAEDQGLDVAPMPEAAQAKLKELVPFAAPRNPVDVTAQFFNDLTLVPKFLTEMLNEGGYDGLLGFWTSVAGNPNLADPLIQELVKTVEGRKDTLFIHSLLADDAIRERYEAEGFPCFDDPTRAVNAMAALMFAGESFAKGRAETPAIPDLPPLPGHDLNEAEAKALLAEAGLPMVEDRIATSAEEATGMPGPLAMKIVSPDIQHKTEAGGVALNVSAEDAAMTFDRLIANARVYAPEARIDG